ncbi:hypothetical protein RB195_024854 [Necator americanus]|uniref:Uncharacterized protein n=1 Tax=Necator americanus TaxID=51031 RepID=A0ABR1EQ02_NECAM
MLLYAPQATRLLLNSTEVSSFIMFNYTQIKINVAGAFGYVRSVEREWSIRNPSVAHENRLLQIQLKTDASTCFIELGQHSFRWLMLGVISTMSSAKRKWCAVDHQPSLPCRPIQTFALRSRWWL